MASRKLNASLVFRGAQQTWCQTVRHKQLFRYLLIIHKVFRFLTEPRRESELFSVENFVWLRNLTF